MFIRNSPLAPNILGNDGPQISKSIAPISNSSSAAKAHDNIEVKVDFPTPPFPDNTRILCLIVDNLSFIMGISGSGPFGKDSQISLLEQSVHASPLPAFSDSGPGQCSGSGSFKCGFSIF
ncbi:hypothetical protein WICMUC_002768 [Wickerhamomyces mucosus]|uniref:Uncharacterized protein n=1 Tax=Wickerhamomyces mucosus TaxID=1378264 RepID=A0A9P8PNE8_9ASCO|nr:hypothetical protein WICMUC_002768 [Wickerhamomyces mucosus]